ncbi:MAG: hypothetical protein Q6K99_00595 [Thermostichales cyanobacterium BF4_bins_65]
MDAAAVAALKERVERIRQRRPAVARLLRKPDLGSLRIDVEQALEEIDELLQEFDQTFSS